MRTSFSFAAGLIALVSMANLSAAEKTVEQWSVYEAAFTGPTNGNPFLDVKFFARFTQGDSMVEANGFYDGDGIYRVRFMPEKPGEWHYTTSSSVEELNGKTGEFTVTKPSVENHGPVQVANTFHFAYADGTPYKQLGTTCYVWQLQDEALQEQTLKTLAASPFNKIRFCVFPKRYTWNTNEPSMYPFAGNAGDDELGLYEFQREILPAPRTARGRSAEAGRRGRHHFVSSLRRRSLGL